MKRHFMIQKLIFGVKSLKGEQLALFLVSIPPYAFSAFNLVWRQEQLYTFTYIVFLILY
jgi:hypothetical protein